MTKRKKRPTKCQVCGKAKATRYIYPVPGESPRVGKRACDKCARENEAELRRLGILVGEHKPKKQIKPKPQKVKKEKAKVKKGVRGPQVAKVAVYRGDKVNKTPTIFNLIEHFGPATLEQLITLAKRGNLGLTDQEVENARNRNKRVGKIVETDDGWITLEQAKALKLKIKVDQYGNRI